MIHFVGAGPGAEDLITIRGEKLIREADVIVYAGSLVNPALLLKAKEDCEIFNSASMTLTEVVNTMTEADRAGKQVVRLHTGDPSIYGAIREQMDALDAEEIAYDVTPGVSSFCGAAASLQLEYTLPGISQSVILTRMDGRCETPEKESVEALAAHETTMVYFLSAGDLERLCTRLIAAGRKGDTPCALVYKATWEDEKSIRATLETLPQLALKEGITKTALVIVGEVVDPEKYEASRLYAADFSHGFRKAEK